MSIEFQINVEANNTISNTTNFYVPIIVEQTIGGCITLYTGKMPLHQNVEVIDWIKVYEQADIIAKGYFIQMLSKKVA